MPEATEAPSAVVYVVCGCSGAYDTRSEWLVRAFEDEAAAQAFAGTLNAIGRLGDPASEPLCDIDKVEEIERLLRQAGDPNGHCQRPHGAEYSVERVAFVAAAVHAS